jgi:hypothetical protein
MSLLQFYCHIQSTDKPGYHWKPARDPLEASQGPMKGSRGPTRGQLGDNQEHKIERHTKMTLHMDWHLKIQVWIPLEASQGPTGGQPGPDEGQPGANQGPARGQPRAQNRETYKNDIHILWSLTSRSIPSLVQNRNQSSIISCLSDSREDTGQASFCGFKLMTKNIIIQNYEHAWRK